MKRILLLTVLFAAVQIQLFAESWEDSRSKVNLLISQKNYSQALSEAEKMLNVATIEFGKDSKYHAETYARIGEIYFMTGNYNKAIENLTIAKDLKKQTLGADNPSYTTSLNNLGVVLQELGRYREAEPLMLEALEIKKQQVGEQDSSYAVSLHNLAQIYQAIGNYDKAEQYYLAAIKIKKQTMGEMNPSYAKSIINLGLLYRTLGNYENAISNIEKGVAIYKKVFGENHIETSSAEFNLAMAYLAIGDSKKAEPLLKKAQEFQNRSGGESHPDYTKTLYNLAMLQWSLKNYDETEKLLVKTMGIVEQRRGNANPLFSSCLNSLGVIYWTQGKMEKAYEYLSKAVYLRKQLFGSKHPDLATSIHNLAGLLKDIGKYQEAEEKYKEAFALYQQQIDDYFPFLSENEKAKFYAKLKERFDMFNCYVLQRKDDNPNLIDLMYDYQLKTKAILLSSSKKVRERILSSGNNELIENYQRWLALKEDLSKYYSMSVIDLRQKGISIDSIENLVNTLEKDISKQSKIFESEYEKQAISWKDVALNLKDNEAAVEIIRFNYFSSGWTDTVFYALLIVTNETKDHPKLIVKYNGRELENLFIHAYQNAVQLDFPDDDSYGAFWKEADELLQNKDRIYVSQDGVYNKISLATLRKPDGSFLIDEQEIVLVSNTAEIVKRKTKPTSQPEKMEAYLFGYPDYDMSLENKLIDKYKSQLKKSKIPPLPGTKQEIDVIKALLTVKNWDSKVYMQKKATENEFKDISQGNIIHVATHGFFKDDVNYTGKDKVFGVDIEKSVDNPLFRSGLLFAGASNYMTDGEIMPEETDNHGNGVLTAYEAMNLNLESTELMVMSACETGLGEIKNGEGVYGLQRSFMVAGAKNIIMSLWKVNDVATQKLMVSFYSYWLGGKNIHEAFRQAQLDLKEIAPSPKHWGAFILISG